jgi:hypothetical protein
MLNIFFAIKGIVHKEFILAGQSIPHTTMVFNGQDFILNFGDKLTGCCITTMQRLTLPSVPGIDLACCNFSVSQIEDTSILTQLRQSRHNHMQC